MSSINTFLFEEIKLGPIVNKDTIRYPESGHGNASGDYVAIQYRRGRYDQTEGRILGEVNGHIPACPYHMPRNNKRYMEPNLHIAKKSVSDIIQAQDINNLIDKIKLFQYAWEAEANNVYNYDAVTGYPNSKVDTSKLKYISPSNIIIQPPVIHDSKLSGDSDTLIPNTANFFGCSGSSLITVKNELTLNYNAKTNTFISWNTPLPFGFPQELDDIKNTDNYTLIHAGHSPIIGIKAVQYLDVHGIVSLNYKLMTVPNDTDPKVIQDKDGNDLIFKYDTQYIISWLPDNQPDTNPKYFGFILYYLGNSIITGLPPTEILEDITYVPAAQNITGFGTMAPASFGNSLQVDKSKTITPLGETNPVSYNLGLALSNINLADPTSESYSYTAHDKFWAKMLPKAFWNESYDQYKARIDTFVANFRLHPGSTITIPAQKVFDNKCWRKENGIWIEQDYIYVFAYISAASRLSEASYEDSEGNMVNLYNPGFEVHAGRWNHRTKTMTWNESNPFGTFKVKSSRIVWGRTITYYEYDDTFFDNPIQFLAQQAYSGPSVSSEFGFPYMVNNFLCLSETQYAEEGSYQIDYHFNETGGVSILNNNPYFPWMNSEGQVHYYYTVGIGCPDGTAPVNGLCKIESTSTLTITDMVDTSLTNYTKIIEKDITYSRKVQMVGSESFPTIKGSDFKQLKTVLSGFIDSIVTLSKSQINNGTSDSTTFQEISTFLSTQVASGSAFNKDEPDTSFSGYTADASAIIKLEFYNILVDAYKIIINGCICNADCACNLVCACNTNCGCNY